MLHVHLSPEGRQHVDVAMLPIHNDAGELLYFVELLTPVNVASAELSTRQMVGRSAAFNELVNLVNLQKSVKPLAAHLRMSLWTL